MFGLRNIIYIYMYIHIICCWFETSGVSQVWSETDPCTRRARRDRERGKPLLIGRLQGYEARGLIDKGLSWTATRWVDLRNCPTESRLHPWKQLPLWDWWAERTFQGQGRGERSLRLPSPAQGSTCGHILSITSFNTSPLLTGSSNVICSASSTVCPERPIRGFTSIEVAHLTAI